MYTNGKRGCAHHQIELVFSSKDKRKSHARKPHEMSLTGAQTISVFIISVLSTGVLTTGTLAISVHITSTHVRSIRLRAPSATSRLGRPAHTHISRASHSHLAMGGHAPRNEYMPSTLPGWKNKVSENHSMRIKTIACTARY